MNQAWWLIDQLVKQGVRRFCIAPGSRSTPLALAAEEHPLTDTIVHFDERGLGFYALGYAMGSQQPAALIVTSGTAIANLAPSVLEAHHSYIPMILLTADRPYELRDSGANQTTDQIKFFEGFVRWQADLPPILNEAYFRSVATQAVFNACKNPPGPVHLNCQFREPFFEGRSQNAEGRSKRVSLHFPKLIAEPPPCSFARGLILIGRIPCNPEPILRLAERLQWPVFADILSNARLFPSPTQIRRFDSLKPEFLLHFGERLTEKKLLDFDLPTLHVSPYPTLQDPARRNPDRIQTDIEHFCTHFQAPTDPTWLPQWQALDLPRQPTNPEATAVQDLSSLISPNHAIFLGNSMPIRNADHFLFPPTCRGFFANRGLSGIDGNIATAAGLSDGLNAPTLALLGDQTCLYDLNSLPLLKDRPLLLLISNNSGGAIFSHLPIATSPHFNKLFKAPHSWTFEGAAQMFDIPYTCLEACPSSLPLSGIVELQFLSTACELKKFVRQ